MRARHFKSGMVGSRGGLCSGLFFVQGLKQWTIFLHICMYIPNITVTRRDTFSFVSMFCLPLSLDRVHRMDIFSVKASHHTEIIKTKMTAILRDSRKKNMKSLAKDHLRFFNLWQLFAGDWSQRSTPLGHGPCSGKHGSRGGSLNSWRFTPVDWVFECGDRCWRQPKKPQGVWE